MNTSSVSIQTDATASHLRSRDLGGVGEGGRSNYPSDPLQAAPRCKKSFIAFPGDRDQATGVMSDSGAISNRTRSRSAKTQEKRREVEDNADLVSGEGSDVEDESESDSGGAIIGAQRGAVASLCVDAPGGQQKTSTRRVDSLHVGRSTNSTKSSGAVASLRCTKREAEGGVESGQFRHTTLSSTQYVAATDIDQNTGFNSLDDSSDDDQNEQSDAYVSSAEGFDLDDESDDDGILYQLREPEPVIKKTQPKVTGRKMVQNTSTVGTKSRDNTSKSPKTIVSRTPQSYEAVSFAISR